MSELHTLIADALFVSDVRAHNADYGFVQIMAVKNVDVRKDIPIAMEMYSLLSHYLETVSIEHVTLADEVQPRGLEQGIEFDRKNQRVLLKIKIGRNELMYVAHWIADRLPSAEVKSMAGLLVIPFSIEAWNEKKYLVPEWFAGYYVDSNSEHCVPILTMQSILLNDKFGGDWVEIALNRMAMFGLPVETAKNSIKTKVDC